MPSRAETTERTQIQGAQTIARVFAVLRCVARAPEGISASEIARQVELSRPTVLRLLAALKAERFVRFEARTSRYVVGPGALELTGCYMSLQTIRQTALPFLWELAETSRETINLCVEDESEVICIDQVESQQTIRAVNWMAKRFPLASTAAGKALIAFLPRPDIDRILARQTDSAGLLPRYTEHTITNPEYLLQDFARSRERGYVEAHDELEIGLAAVAAPVFDRDGALIASICISGPSFRFTEEHTGEMGRQAAACAGCLSAALGYRGSADSAAKGQA